MSGGLVLAASSQVPTWVTIVAPLVGVGGLGGMIVALLKIRPEAGQVIVSTAQGAVVVQSGVIDDLRDQLQAMRDARDEDVAAWEVKFSEQDGVIADLRRRVAGYEAVAVENARLRRELDELGQENVHLKRRVRDLERDLAKVKGERPPNGDRRTTGGEQ